MAGIIDFKFGKEEQKYLVTDSHFKHLTDSGFTLIYDENILRPNVYNQVSWEVHEPDFTNHQREEIIKIIDNYVLTRGIAITNQNIPIVITGCTI